MTFDTLFFVECLLQILPDFEILRSLARQHDAAALAFRRVEINIDIIAHLDLHITLPVSEFLDGNLPFGFVADIDQHMSRRDANDPAFNDPAGFDRAQALFKHRFEFVGAACRCALLLFIPVEP